MSTKLTKAQMEEQMAMLQQMMDNMSAEELRAMAIRKQAQEAIQNLTKNNVYMTVEDNKLTITVDLSKELGESTSGKSINIATTKGSVKINEDVSVSLNIYKKK